MKKLLALVLALVMSMSLVTISNAAFKDADSIDYKEAVDVMNAVGVFVGDEKGNFNPKENLTRAQAAKIISYLLLCIGIAFSNRCGLPIIPTDLFPRELAQITGISYPKIKISYDVICLLTTAILTFLFLGQIRGLGIGTIMAAFTMGKSIGMIGNILDRHFRFATAKDLKKS